MMVQDKAAMRRNNPKGEPVGHFTGRCYQCGSKDLWDDATAYGCNACDALYMTGNMGPIVISNAPREDLPDE